MEGRPISVRRKASKAEGRRSLSLIGQDGVGLNLHEKIW